MALKKINETSRELPEKVNILGAEYTIVLDKINRDNAHGECDFQLKKITLFVDDTIKTSKSYDVLDTLIHEVIHAILNESGLTHNSTSVI